MPRSNELLSRVGLARAEDDEEDKKPFAKTDDEETAESDEDEKAENAAESDDEEDKAESDDDEEKAEDEEEETSASSRAAERRRIAGILGCKEAKGREAQARAFALESDMSVKDARRFLAAAPKESGTGLAGRMASVIQPDVGAGGDGGAASEVDQAAAGILKFTRQGSRRS